MQPFVAADAGAFNPLIASIPDPLKELQKQIAFKSGIDAQQTETAFKRAQIGAAATKQQRMQQFQGAMQAYLANPSATGLASLLGQFPEFSEEAKSAFEALDKDRRTTDVTQMGEAAALAAGGDFNGAAELLKKRIDADAAAGHADEHDQMVYGLLSSGDPAKQKQGLGLLSYAIGSAVGFEHAAPVLKAWGLSQEPDVTVVSPGADAIDPRTGKVIYSSPYRPQTISGPDGTVYQLVPKGGGAPAGIAAPQASIGSTLAAVFPRSVVAGFLGNIEVEGGLGGARGDGGKAKGIAQWRSDRLANYEKAVGRPFDPADHEGQARFIIWEMNNPEAAGMTIAQRDAILAARTPQQAAALIDQYYERSSGVHRSRRMTAAARYAGSGIAVPDMVALGNINLHSRPVVRNSDGTISTIRTISVGTDRGEVLIPTVIGGRVVSDDEAVRHYRETGEHLGVFKSARAATAYARKLHEQQSQEYGTPLRVRSIQEANALKPGTRFIDPNGVERIR